MGTTVANLDPCTSICFCFTLLYPQPFARRKLWCKSRGGCNSHLSRETITSEVPPYHHQHPVPGPWPCVCVCVLSIIIQLSLQKPLVLRERCFPAPHSYIYIFLFHSLPSQCVWSTRSECPRPIIIVVVIDIDSDVLHHHLDHNIVIVIAFRLSTHSYHSI